MKFSISRLAIASLFLCTSPSVAQTSDWSVVASTDSGAVYSIRDRDIANTSNYSPKVWVEANYKNDKTVKYRSAKILYEFDCRNLKYRRLDTIYYNADGSVINSGGYAYSWDYIAPDTVVEGIAMAACPLGSF